MVETLLKFSFFNSSGKLLKYLEELIILFFIKIIHINT